ncbi:MAG: ABC transporter substrate-binding protein [Acidobacteria bacterium]|nr:ABC transporter substrate-binding protein [Acidobacteriota bacterium]
MTSTIATTDSIGVGSVLMKRWALLGTAIALMATAACGKTAGAPIVRFLDRPDTGGGWKEIISEFEAANPDINVELVEGPASTNAREDMYSLSLSAADGTYDIVYMDVIWVPKFAARGWLQSLDHRLPPVEREKFLPGDIRGSTYQGSLYRVPMRSDAGMLYYRTDLVAKPPETFEELAATARRLQKPPELWGVVFQGQQYEGLVCAFLEVLWGFGADVLDADGNVVLDSPEAVRALTWLSGLVGDVAPGGVTTYQEEDARHLFQEGHAVFMRNWPYVWTLAQQVGSPVAGKIGIAPMPHVPGQRGAATLGGWGFGLAKSARHPEAAWRFIAFATQPEQQKILHLRGGAIPARRDLFRDPEILKASPYYSDLYRILLAARPRPVHPKYAQISNAIQVHVSAALVGAESPDEAIKRAAQEVRGILGR